jgi:hypothetical protein
VLVTSRLEILFAAQHQAGDLPCRFLWDGLSSALLQENEHAAWACCAEVARGDAGMTHDGGACILAVMQNDFALPLWRLFNLHDMVEAWLDKEASVRVALFDSPLVVPYWTDSGDTSSLLTAVMAAACATRQIEHSHHPHPAAGEAVHQTPERRPPVPPGAPVDGPVDVLSYCAFMGWPEQEALIEQVATRGECGWMLVSDGRAVAPIPSAHYQDWLDLPMHCEFAALTPEQVRTAFVEAAPSRFGALLERAELDFVWVQFRNWLWTGARWRRLGLLLDRAYRPRVFLSGGESGKGGAWCLNDGFASAGARVISLAHSGMGYTSLKRWMSGYRGNLLVWGDEDARALRPWVDQSARLTPTGSMRRDLAYIGTVVSQDNTPAPRTPPTVVFFTQRVGDDAVAWAHPSRHAALWTRLLAFVRARPDLRFVIKGHPRYDYWDLYEGPEFRSLPNLSISRDPARSLLVDAGLAVLVNSPSTVSLEAMAVNVPVLYLKDDDPVGRDALIEQDGVEVVTGADGMGPAIDRLLGDPALRHACIDRQQAFLRRAFIYTGPDSVEAVDQVVGQTRDGATRSDAVDTCAQALTEFIRALGAATAGGMNLDEFSRRARRVRSAWAQPGDTVARLIDLRRFGGYALHMACWRSAVSRGVPASRLVIAAYRGLPRSVRPSPRILLRYLKESLTRDAREPRAARTRAVETP